MPKASKRTFSRMTRLMTLLNKGDLLESSFSGNGQDSASPTPALFGRYWVVAGGVVAGGVTPGEVVPGVVTPVLFGVAVFFAAVFGGW